MFTLSGTFQKLFPNLRQEAADCEKSYKLSRVIGEGVHSVVRLGELRSDHRQKYAIKVIAHEALDDIEEHFLAQEIEILQDLSHPNIVAMKDVFYGKDTLYMVMELMQGGDLFDRLDAQRVFSEPEAAEVLQQMLTAIAFLHSRNIIHRDIKPENFLYSRAPLPSGAMSSSTAASAVCSSSSSYTTFPSFHHGFPSSVNAATTTDGDGDGPPTPRPVLKLTDFALAITVKPNELIYEPVGTPVYLAPEVVRAAVMGYGREVDVWAAGIVLYTLLCGFPPFYDENDQVLFRMIQEATSRTSDAVNSSSTCAETYTDGTGAGDSSREMNKDWDTGRARGCGIPFPSPEFDHTTDGAKDVMRRMLRTNACDRCTAEQARSHPWVASGAKVITRAAAANEALAALGDVTAGDQAQAQATANQQSYAARRRLVGAIRAVQAQLMTNRIRKGVAKEAKDTSSSSNSVSSPTEGNAASMRDMLHLAVNKSGGRAAPAEVKGEQASPAATDAATATTGTDADAEADAKSGTTADNSMTEAGYGSGGPGAVTTATAGEFAPRTGDGDAGAVAADA